MVIIVPEVGPVDPAEDVVVEICSLVVVGPIVKVVPAVDVDTAGDDSLVSDGIGVKQFEICILDDKLSNLLLIDTYIQFVQGQ